MTFPPQPKLCFSFVGSGAASSGEVHHRISLHKVESNRIRCGETADEDWYDGKVADRHICSGQRVVGHREFRRSKASKALKEAMVILASAAVQNGAALAQPRRGGSHRWHHTAHEITTLSRAQMGRCVSTPSRLAFHRQQFRHWCTTSCLRTRLT